VIVSAADAVELDISTKRPATSPSDHGDCGTTGRNFCAGDKTIERDKRSAGEQRRKQLQDGIIELLWQGIVAFTGCRKWQKRTIHLTPFIILFGGEMGTLDDASFSEQCLMATRA
jgi:hypothetical protein